MIASDNFQWDVDTTDGERVADTVCDWADHAVNYLLTLETTRKFKERLVSGKNLFTDEDVNRNHEL